eukprot:Rhum_TRINITY_DN9815_c0_g1::Rhum_TRINITY_DN9815_c0_g1_i1::g.35401::m.35401
MGEYAALAAAAEEDIIDGLSATRRSSAPALASGGVGGRADTPSLSSSLSGTPSHLGQTVRRPSDGARPRALEKRKSLQTTASDSLSDSVSMLLGGRELGSENTVRGGSGSGDGRPTSLRLSKTSLAAIGSSTSQQPRMAKRKSITFAFDFPAVPDEPVSAGSALGSPASPASPAATEAAAPSAAFPAVAFDAGAPRPASRTASDVSSAGTAAAGPHATETLDMYPKPFSRASPARRMRFEGAGDLETSPRRRRGGPDAGGAGTEAEKPRGDEAKESSEGDAGVASAAQATPAPAPAAAVRTTGRLTHYDAAAYAQFASGEHGTTVGPAGLPTNNPAGASVSAPSPAVAAAAAAARHRLGRSPVALPLPHEVTAPLTGVDRDLHALSMVRGQRAAFALETDELHNQYYSTGSRAYYDDGHGEEVEAAGQPMSVALDDKADALGRAVFLLEKELHGLQARHAGALRVQQETEAAQRRLQASRDGVEIDFDGDGSRGAALAASEADAALDMGSVRAAHAEWRACVQRAGVVLESVFEELQRQRKASMLALDGDEPRWDLARLESRLIAAQAKLDDMALVGRGDAPYAAAAPAAPAPETLQHSTQTAAPPPPTPPQPAPLPSWRAAPADAASSAPRAPETASHQGTLRSDAMSLSATAPAPFPTPLTSAEVTATAPAPAPSTATAGEPAPGAVYPIGGRPLRAATSFVEGFSYSTPSRRLRHTPAAARVTGGGSAAAGGVPAVPAERAAAAERYHDLFYRGWAHLDGDAPAGVVFGADVAASGEGEDKDKDNDNGDDVSEDFEAALERKIQNFDNLEGEDPAVGLARGFIASGAMHTSRGQPFRKNQCYVARSTDGFCRTRFAQVADTSGQFVWGGGAAEDAPHPRRDDGRKLFFMLAALAGGGSDAVRLSNLSRVRSLHPEVPHAFAFEAIETGYDVPDTSGGGTEAEERQARLPSARPSYMHVASSADRGFLGASHARQSKEVKSRARPRPVTYVVQMNQREASVWTEFLGLWSDAA